MFRHTITLLAASVFMLAPGALAQEAINTDAATQPSTGSLVLRSQFRYAEASRNREADQRDINEYTSSTTFIYGLRNDLALSLNVPIKHQRFTDGSGSRRHVTGVDDLTALIKHRFFQHDYGPVNTMRASIIGGAEIRSGDSDFTSDSYNPILGAVYTQIHERHGINAAVQWKFMTGSGIDRHDQFRYDAAYLFRIDPAEYSATTTAATYAVLELNGLYETHGDHRIFISPGILYEARRYALEATVQLPILNDVSRREKTKFVFGVGIRLVF